MHPENPRRISYFVTLKHEKCKVKVSKGVSVLVVLVKSDGGAGYEDGETSGPRIRATGSLSLYPAPGPLW